MNSTSIPSKGLNARFAVLVLGVAQLMTGTPVSADENASHAILEGCYRISVGEWDPKLKTSPDDIFDFVTTPTEIALLADGSGLRTSNSRGTQLDRIGWSKLDDENLHVIFSDGLAGVTFTLKSGEEGYHGVANIWTDAHLFPTANDPKAPVAMTKFECDLAKVKVRRDCFPSEDRPQFCFEDTYLQVPDK